jgi:LacI family transcriptional regulator
MNLEEIARLSGFSRSTVSRVVNNDHRVRASTRQRVQEVIRQANYQPHPLARALAGGRSGILGVVIPLAVAQVLVDPYFSLLIQGVSAACNQRDYSVMLWLAEPEHERRTIRRIVQSGMIDGLIVASALIDDPLLETLVATQFPFVLIGRHAGQEPISYVDVDNEKGAREAVRHLIRLGRRRIATISGPANMVAGLDRLEGYREALEEAALPRSPNLIAAGDFTEESGYRAMGRLLAQKPDAVFVASDTMALGALRALREAGLRAPTDIALAGFDDMPAAAHCDPPLTTVRQPTHQSGAVATETLLDLLDNPGLAPRRVVLPVELVIRESCGARE